MFYFLVQGGQARFLLCLARGAPAAEHRESIMRLIKDYLCDQVKRFLKTKYLVLAPILRLIWDKWLKNFIYALAVDIIANIIADLLLK
jgi:hypothetical protein